MTQYIDSRHSTINTTRRDQINFYYTNVPGSSNQQSSLLSFNDAPINLLSPHFSGREEELDQIEKAFTMTYGPVPARYAVHGIPGIGETRICAIQ